MTFLDSFSRDMIYFTVHFLPISKVQQKNLSVWENYDLKIRAGPVGPLQKTLKMYFYVLLNCLLWPFMHFLGMFYRLEVIFMLINVQKNKFQIFQKWAWPTNDPLIM